jgi:transposase InsO family protein
MDWVHWHNNERIHSYIAGECRPAEYEEWFNNGLEQPKIMVVSQAK